jgi:hypothetical protein
MRFSFANDLHTLQLRSGLPSFGLSQLIAFANILAVEVFPVPLGPVNKYAPTVLS